MRDDLEARFLETERRLKQLRTSPPLEVRVLLWTLHQQATCGDHDKAEALAVSCSYEDDIKRRGWGALKGTPKDAAMWLYLRLADLVRD
ncbi:acyl-CoA-binding protein [Pseudomonas entomophila]|uniref:acyl-CoA-binding protein n=1 Tax=Pseudomonas entomophila TaxID=312306 RepID=UPI0020103DA9|nr:acyl-CoA-binding protein [Pseudomonas entomophila]